ncbi:UxaA family hydrolase [Porticoccus sp. W117]|uniref:UxaA family hydrolase n=1 Tax=Porticoccus sp. W117 TaxID=3054777 RepID=UPI002595C75F|nr:UxaA family hydrolase [Porticoccus sp. W117]MDM3872120.1 UxaA family hydrolase [Porticoccus sp. W117]
MTAQSNNDVIALHPADNIGVSRRNLLVNETIIIDGALIRIAEEIPVGHKVALGEISAGNKIIKYGASIGSATADIATGRHVHLHNMKSDYIASHTRDVVSH